MTKLNQIIALTAGKKSGLQKKMTDLYHKIQKPDLLNGIARSYRPKDEDGEQLPSENKHVQVKASDVLREASAALTELFDIILVQDVTNTSAVANLTVDGQLIYANVPVTYLLFLEKQLVDIGTLVDKLPVLDPAEVWQYDASKDCYATPPYQSAKTKKVYRNHVKAEATDKHPAQVEIYTEDAVVGYWSNIKLSGAIPAKEKNAILERVRKLSDAVKLAREQANSIEAVTAKIGNNVFSYLFGGNVNANTKSAS